MHASSRLVGRTSLALGLTLGLITAGLAAVTLTTASPPVHAVPPGLYVAASGTVGDGSSCDSPGYVGNTHAAIASALAAASAGDTIHLCPGTFQITSTIIVDKEVTLQGAGAPYTVLDGGTTARIMETTNSATPSLFNVTVSGLQFRNGKTTGSIARGGAILNALNVTLYVNDSLFRNNRANEHGGAINIGLHGTSGVGNGTLHIARSTFLDNYATADGGAISDFRDASAISTVVNSTFVGNRAGRDAGAVNGGRGLRISFSTFINNAASAGKPSVATRAALTGSLVIVADPAQPCWALNSSDPQFFPWVTVSANVSNDTECLSVGTAPVTVESMAVSFLAPWGGATPTVRIDASSSAINAVPAASCPATDQRGVAREVNDTTCDAGAFEFTASPPSLVPERISAAMIQGMDLDGVITAGLGVDGLTDPTTFRVASEVSAELPSALSLNTGTGAVTGTPVATTATGTTYVITAAGTNGAVASALITVDNCILPLVDGSYRIDSRADLDIFHRGFCGVSARYVQEADIAWNAAWTGVGTSGTRFTGTYDGGGKEITGLTMNSGSGHAAFVSYANNATVSALHLEATVSGGQRSGAVIGLGTATRLVDVHVSGTVTRPTTASTSGCVGGLAGRLESNSLVLRSSFTGTVTASAGTATGGLVGCAVSSSVERSTVDGLVNGADVVGGLVGLLETGEVVDSYATGTVIATGIRLGGLVGYADRDSGDADQVAVTRSYASATLSGATDVGGVVGLAANSTTSAVFWQAGLAGADGIDAIGRISTGGPLPGLSATPLAGLQAQATFASAGWAIAQGWESADTSSNAWGICEGSGTPFLLWKFTSSPCPVANTVMLPWDDLQNPPVSTTVPRSTPSATVPTTPTTTPTAPPTPTIEPTVVVPSLPAGGSAIEVGGVRQNQALTWESPSDAVGRIGSLDVRIRFGGSLLGVGSPGQVAPGAAATVILAGAQPGSEVSVTLFSTPRSLGTAKVGSDGTLHESLIIPVDAEAGEHHLRLQATNAAGEAVTVWLAIGVDAAPMVLPATGTERTLAVFAWWMLVGGLMCLALVRRARRLTAV